MKYEKLTSKASGTYYGTTGVLMTMRDGAEYTTTENGNFRRVNRDHRTKKERNRDKKLVRKYEDAK